MTLNKIIFLALSVLVPGGLLILALRCLVKSGFVESLLRDPRAEIG